MVLTLQFSLDNRVTCVMVEYIPHMICLEPLAIVTFHGLHCKSLDLSNIVGILKIKKKTELFSRKGDSITPNIQEEASLTREGCCSLSC